jgi:ubiquinone/menaquinone biosynthesis C-methylase UbiE/DNA-binding transcriptional ArsR family regulator
MDGRGCRGGATFARARLGCINDEFVCRYIKTSLYLRAVATASINELLSGLRAAAEPTRLRLLALAAQAELTVTEITQILGQSQPRVSRHLKLLCEAGLLDRFREGSWVFYRLARDAALARQLAEMVPADDPALALDLERLERIKQARADAAQAYFRENAPQWDRIRSLYVEEREVEARLLDLLPEGGIGDFLDLGTGTGRMIELLGPRVERGIGIDLSRDMLAVARVNLERAGLRHCAVRQGDIYQLPFPTASFDAVLVHQVLHYVDRPAAAVAEAARVLRPGGRLVIVDFAPHGLEFLRAEHKHRRLGFAEGEVAEWLRAAGLDPLEPIALPGGALTVVLWVADRPPARLPRPDATPPGRRAKEPAIGLAGVAV